MDYRDRYINLNAGKARKVDTNLSVGLRQIVGRTAGTGLGFDSPFIFKSNTLTTVQITVLFLLPRIDFAQGGISG